VDVEELAARFADGDMIKELARQHSISESSVKRLLRATGVRRGQGST
jgi:DNA-binding CsgD family transcriptional regulator